MKKYPQALLLALLGGFPNYIGIAAGRHATVVSAIPYGLATAAFLAVFGSALVAYRNGQPRR